MKKLVLVSSLLVAFNAIAGDHPLTRGVDLSTNSTITGQDLNNLIDNAYTKNFRGMIIVTNGTPDPGTFSYFLWMNSAYDPPVAMIYAPILSMWTNMNSGITINSNNIAANSIGYLALQTNSVRTYHIQDGSVTFDKIPNQSLTGLKFASSSIGQTNLNMATIVMQSSNIAASAVVNSNIANDAITAFKIKNGVVDQNKLSLDVRRYLIYSGTYVLHDMTSTTETYENQGWDGLYDAFLPQFLYFAVAAESNNVTCLFQAPAAYTNYNVICQASPVSSATIYGVGAPAKTPLDYDVISQDANGFQMRFFNANASRTNGCVINATTACSNSVPAIIRLMIGGLGN